MKTRRDLTCAVCSGSDFEAVWLPDATGRSRVDSGLRVCRRCRLVLAPLSEPRESAAPAAPKEPGLGEGWVPGGK